MTKKQLREYCNAEFENIDSVLSELALVIKPKKQNTLLLNWLLRQHLFITAITALRIYLKEFLSIRMLIRGKLLHGTRTC